MKLDKEFIGLQKYVDKLIKAGEKDIARNYKKVLDALRLYFAKLYTEYATNGKLTFSEMSKYNRLKKVDEKIYNTISGLYQNNKKIIRCVLRGITIDIYNNTIDIVEGATGRKLKNIVKGIDVTETINTEMAGLRWTERIQKHRDDVIWTIQKEIKQGLTTGDTYDTMAKRLKKELGTSAGKANTIVRTEGHRCLMQAETNGLDSISKHGVKMMKQWISSKDERVRSQHSEMDGIEVPYEEDFVLPDGARGKAPGLIGEPQHDINCRCIITIRTIDE